jgi:hypothetical protein
MSASYCYTPLDENAKQIRLLTLLPLAFPSITHSPAVHISLELVQLTQENVPQFEALSYAWGSPEDPVEILIETETGSQALKVTQNLYEALHHLRLENQPRVLWIDAICINQQDIPERSTQVKRMADIYTLSKRVVVWLGPEVDDSSLALDLLESLGSKIEVDWPRWRMNATSEEPSEQHWADRYQSLPYNDRELTAIVRLCELPWFERLWIWQEIWLAGPSAILVCGRKTLLWEIFRKACFCTINKARWITVSRARCELLDHLCCKSPYQPFSSLAIDTQLAKCSDPRDRIFAMRSLVRPEDPVAKIEPDYAKGVFEVYRETFLTCSSQHESLLLMSRCELAQRAVDIPTWLPNVG